ncbi:MAG TPA: hypothetical protein VF727_00670 [Allosphingosinicella sp.]|jgi:hypothetical protein
MQHRATSLIAATLIAGAFALSACQGEDEAVANAGNDADPALTSALENEIMVDPNLAQGNQAARAGGQTAASAPGGNAAARAGGTAQGAGQPPALAAAAQAGGGPGCTNADQFDYGPGWANRGSPVFPLYPGAKVTEAAGNNGGNCRARVITFTTSDNFERVLDWYHTKAVRAGYSSEQQVRDGDRILGGANERDGGAFYLIVTPKPAGAEVALITNNGT